MDAQIVKAMRLMAVAVGLASATMVSAQLPERQAYAAKYKDWAIEEMERTGIPASITLAQGILESDCGRSDLAVEANNHFGIKCHSTWTGRTKYKDDDRRNECFRSYDSAFDSFRDHSDFLTGSKRYAVLFSYDKTDYVSWAHGLKSCGYATEKTYAERLIKIIEEEGLHIYDTAEGKQTTPDTYGKRTTKEDKTDDDSLTPRRAVGKAVFEINPLPPHEVMYNNGVRYVEVGNADTFESIATEFHLMTWELFKYNDLTADAKISDLTFIYLRPKRNRAHPDCSYHTAKAGDTMWSIAHSYGIKLRKLLRKNGMTQGEEPTEGQEIRLR
ncbi:MAG: glucosaminidase domain-containing protein [Bacteroidales bacterium]|nr:glucosaminidase domain-containing protein [Bacteroidales bacterium]MDY4175366.1 glucosaminidase domain-containing protein [Bacteroidales bacterium]